VDTVTASLRIFADMVAGIKVDADAMRAAASKGYATATDLADYLVRKGVPFRDAHEAGARTVRFAEEHDRDLAELSLDERRQFSPVVAADVHDVLTLEGSVASRDHPGGTAPERVRAAIAAARERAGPR